MELADCGMRNGGYLSVRQTVLFETYIILCTGCWFWTVIIVPYLLSEVEVLQRYHKFQDRQGTGLSHPLQVMMLPSLLLQLLFSAAAAVQTCMPAHPGLPNAGRAVFIKQPTHPGKQADSCQDLEWIKLVENSNTFAHSKWHRSTLPVANANEEFLGQLWNCFLCNRCHPCYVTYLCVLESRDWNRHKIVRGLKCVACRLHGSCHFIWCCRQTNRIRYIECGLVVCWIFFFLN